MKQSHPMKNTPTTEMKQTISIDLAKHRPMSTQPKRPSMAANRNAAKPRKARKRQVAYRLSPDVLDRLDVAVQRKDYRTATAALEAAVRAKYPAG